MTYRKTTNTNTTPDTRLAADAAAAYADYLAEPLAALETALRAYGARAEDLSTHA